MACDLTTGFPLGCNDGHGGIKRALIGPLSALGAVTEGGTDGQIDTIAGIDFLFDYEAEKNTGSFTDNPTTSTENGTFFFNQDLIFVLNRRSQVKRNEVLLLAQQLMVIIIEDMNGDFWLMGQVRGVRLIPSETTSGTAIGDRSGYTLNFHAEEVAPMNTVDSAIIDALIAP